MDGAVEQKEDAARQSIDSGIEKKNQYFVKSSELEMDRNNLYPIREDPVRIQGATVRICACAGVVRRFIFRVSSVA